MSTLKIAIQKSGRLNEDSLKLLKDCGISVENGIDQLKVSVGNFPMEILYLRNSDIPQYVEDGVVDIAIIGENLLIEKQNELRGGLFFVFLSKFDSGSQASTLNDVFLH